MQKHVYFAAYSTPAMVSHSVHISSGIHLPIDPVSGTDLS